MDAFNEQLQAEGHWVFAGGLHPADTAITVRIGTDGARACGGPVEVRPFQDED